MSEAPERIWATDTYSTDGVWINGVWQTQPNISGWIEYVRADIATSQIAEARASAERQWAGWVKEEALRKDAEADRDRLAADVARLRAVARRYLDVTQEYFSDAEYDRNGCLAEAAAKLVVLLYSETARAALASVKE